MGIDYMAPYGAFLGSSAKNGYPKIVQRGDLLGLRGVESLKGRPPPPPKCALDQCETPNVF